MDSGNEKRSREAILKDILAEGIRIQSRFRAEPLYKMTGKGSYQSNTVQEVAATKRSRTP